MTFDSVTFQSASTESSLSQHESCAVTRNTKFSTEPLKQEIANEYCEDTQISNWEDEGGANTDSASLVHRNNSLTAMSTLTAHIDAAENMMEAGQYEAAYDELEAATERFIRYKDKIQRSFDNSISTLSTLGCRATPPHPVALPLVKLRRKLTA